MDELTKDRLAARLIFAERDYKDGHELNGIRLVILVLAELVGIVYKLSNKSKEESE